MLFGVVFLGGRFTLFLHGVRACARVVDQDGLDIIVGGVICVEHGIGDIRYIILSTFVSHMNCLTWHRTYTCIALASDVHFLPLQTKGIHKVLEKAQELLRHLVFICCGWSPLRESGSNRLLYPGGL